MAVETELKLLLPPEAAAGILRQPALRALIRAQPHDHAAEAEGQGLNGTAVLNEDGLVQRKKLHAVYFDTPDKWLAEHGMALRIRRIGRKRIQTLKAPAIGPEGLQNFQEFETEIHQDKPLLAAIGDAKLRRRFERDKVWQRLRPVFETRFHRSAFEVERNGTTFEIAVDHGDIVALGRRASIAEIELEVKSGDPGMIFELAESLALELAEQHPIRLGSLTKAARGYALADGIEPRPYKAREISFGAQVSTEEAFVAIVRNCLDQLRANEEAVLATEDDEAIHQFRVALRRLRAIVGAYRDLIDDDVHALISIDLRWLQRQFGPARDLDVLIAETLKPIHARLRGQPAFDRLIEAAETARAEARRTAHLALENPRYLAMLLQLYGRLHTGDWRRASARARLGARVGDFARPLLQARHKRLMKLGLRADSLPEPELHRLRILAKKMRYGAEAFQCLYRTKSVKKYTSALAAIQDCLGSLNDAFVGRQLLSGIAQRLMLDHGMAAADANLLQGLVLGWQTARITRDLEGFHEIWRTFAKQKRFWVAD